MDYAWICSRVDLGSERSWSVIGNIDWLEIRDSISQRPDHCENYFAEKESAEVQYNFVEAQTDEWFAKRPLLFDPRDLYLKE